MKRVLKTWMGWIIGVVIAALAISFWRNEEMGWGHIVTMSIAGLIGILIGKGIRKIVKKMKMKINE